MQGKLKLWHLATAALLGATAGGASAASCHDIQLHPLQLREHDAHVTLQPGFTRTEATQTLFNPNTAEVEAILHASLPAGAALAEVEVLSGGEGLRGEVLSHQSASALFDAAQADSAGAALARRVENGDLEIRIARMAPESEAQVRWVYYMPFALTRGEGRLDYPGATGAALPGREIWAPMTQLTGAFRLTFDLRFGDSVTDIAVPGFEGAVDIKRPADDRYRVTLEAEPGELGEASVLTFRVEEDLRGSVDLVAHRPDRHGAGTFMMVFTPGPGFAVEAVGGTTPVLHFPGGRVFETTELDAGPLERGAQQVVFGLYAEGGRNRVVLNNGAALGEAPHDTIVTFPRGDDETPELERLWAQGRLDWFASLERERIFSAEAAREKERELGEAYQVVSGSTAFVLMADGGFEERGVARRNASRVRAERLAQSLRADHPVWRTQADLARPFFTRRGVAGGGCCDFVAIADAAEGYGLVLSERPPAAPARERFGAGVAGY